MYPHIIADQVYDAICEDRASQDPQGSWDVRACGDCTSPIVVTAHSMEPFSHLRTKVRCRQCQRCRNAKRTYWALAAVHQAEIAPGRTWFGTLTASPEWHEAALLRAYEKAREDPAAARPDWDNPECETRFAALRAEFLIEIQKYWKRLRAAGAEFRYFLAVERHKSGLPHGHFMLHEHGDPIRKRLIQSKWTAGFSNVSIVAAGSSREAWYVAKYLSKSNQSRQVASSGYRPSGRAVDRVYEPTTSGVERSKAKREQSTNFDRSGAPDLTSATHLEKMRRGSGAARSAKADVVWPTKERTE